MRRDLSNRLTPLFALLPFALPATQGAPALPAAGEGRSEPLVLEGFVFEPGGAPAEGAVVTSSAGGRALSDARGHYRIEIPSCAAGQVQVTATGRPGTNQSAKASVGLTPGVAHVTPLDLVRASTCTPSWQPTFGPVSGFNGAIRALKTFDDGGGSKMYAGGHFASWNSTTLMSTAVWDGVGWSELGGGTDGFVRALETFDDGSGLALYAGGEFSTAGGTPTGCVARWDGASWSAVGGVLNGSALTLCVFDDGSGPALFAGGSSFTIGSTTYRIVKWDGASWSGYAPGLGSGTVRALAVFDDGGGQALYAGGDMAVSGHPLSRYVLKWNGSSWETLGGGVPLQVWSLAALDLGSGPALYVGGNFQTVGGVTMNHIAKWDGASWSALAGGMDPVANVFAMNAYDDGSGLALYAGGEFTTAGGAPASQIARWNGTSWSALGAGTEGVGGVRALAVLEDGGGSELFVGGWFVVAGGATERYLGRWDGASWMGQGGAVGDTVEALLEYDDGSGPALYAGGEFLAAGSAGARRVARWDGSSWTALGSGIGSGASSVHALARCEVGGGAALYAGGSFLEAGGVAASYIARWDGATWSALASGVDNPVFALAEFDEGNGPMLFAGGQFSASGALTTHGIARWNGVSWSSLGTGLTVGSPPKAYAMLVFDDGSGPALFVAGEFRTAGSTSANRIAKWNGSSWSALGSGLSGIARALVVHDDGSGPALYVAGQFTSAGGLAANRIAKWDGTSWSAVGGGMDGFVLALASLDGPGGARLCAGGSFGLADGLAVNRLAQWDGASWSALGGGTNGNVLALGSFESSGATLFAGGEFTAALDSDDAYLARWACPDTTGPVLSFPSSVLAYAMPADPAGARVSFSVTADDDQDPAPDVVCTPPSGSFFPLGTTLVHCTATDASGNSSAAEFPVTVVERARARKP